MLAYEVSTHLNALTFLSFPSLGKLGRVVGAPILLSVNKSLVLFPPTWPLFPQPATDDVDLVT
jgi:hypothetical protein